LLIAEDRVGELKLIPVYPIIWDELLQLWTNQTKIN
jgi:hypothetical protein